MKKSLRGGNKHPRLRIILRWTIVKIHAKAIRIWGLALALSSPLHLGLTPAALILMHSVGDMAEQNCKDGVTALASKALDESVKSTPSTRGITLYAQSNWRQQVCGHYYI